MADYRETMFRPLDRKGGLPPREVEDRLHQIMHDFVGFERSATGLSTAVGRLNALRESASDMGATTMHELLRANEARNLIEVSLLITAGALRRTETQATPWHGVSYGASGKGEKNDFIVVTAAAPGRATAGPPSGWRFEEVAPAG